MLVDDAEWNIFPHMKNHMIRERIMSEFLIIMRERNSLERITIGFLKNTTVIRIILYHFTFIMSSVI